MIQSARHIVALGRTERNVTRKVRPAYYLGHVNSRSTAIYAHMENQSVATSAPA